MKRRNAGSAEELLGPILRSVSRSFYVSIQLLPRRIREPVGLAYLLARATDTLADTVEIPVALRREALQTLVSAIQSEDRRDATVDLGKTFAPLQTNEAERTLIETLPECLEYLARTKPADRQDIRVLLDKITQAQTMDIERFGDRGQLHALATAAELHEYTYLIAGCVGEFWTRLCFRHVRDFAELPEDEMLRLGKSYGAGLQLVNILRDVSADLRAGRCYFPLEELAAAGLNPSEILVKRKQFWPVYEKWLEESERGLDAGMQYVSAVKNGRVRGATVLPALIGARTLALLRAADGNGLEGKVKVPRQEVRGIIGSVAITLASRQRLGAMFRRLLADSSPSSSPR